MKKTKILFWILPFIIIAPLLYNFLPPYLILNDINNGNFKVPNYYYQEFIKKQPKYSVDGKIYSYIKPIEYTIIYEAMERTPLLEKAYKDNFKKKLAYNEYVLVAKNIIFNIPQIPSKSLLKYRFNSSVLVGNYVSWKHSLWEKYTLWGANSSYANTLFYACYKNEPLWYQVAYLRQLEAKLNKPLK